MLDCLHQHAYRRIYLTRVQRVTQLAYLFHQCGTNFLSRDCRIADCTVRHRAWSARFLVSSSNTAVSATSNTFISLEGEFHAKWLMNEKYDDCIDWNDVVSHWIESKYFIWIELLCVSVRFHQAIQFTSDHSIQFILTQHRSNHHFSFLIYW